MEVEFDEDVQVYTDCLHRTYRMNGERPTFEEVVEDTLIAAGQGIFLTRPYATRPEYLGDLYGMTAPADLCLDGRVLVPAGEQIGDHLLDFIGVEWQRTAGLAEAYRAQAE